MMGKRYGTLKISREWFDAVRKGDQFAIRELKRVFKEVIVLDVTHSMSEQVSTYACYSEHFDEIDDGVVPPEYMAMATMGDTYTPITFTRKR